jgi:hypothetical protein
VVGSRLCVVQGSHAGGGVQRSLLLAQVKEPDFHRGARRRQGLLQLALAAMEAALRRAPDALAALDRRAADVYARQARILLSTSSVRTGLHPGSCASGRLCSAATAQGPLDIDMAASAQAVIHAVDVLLAVGAVQPVPLAAKALLATLAKLLAAAHAPGAALEAGLKVSRIGFRSAAAAAAARGGTRLREGSVNAERLPATQRVARGRMRS